MTVSRSSSRKPSANRDNKPKKKPIPKNIRQRCLTAMQKLRRLEEANPDGKVRCISCGRVMDWTEAQGGHYISRTCRATELESDNIWPQCTACNMYKSGNPIAYRYSLARKIGEARVKRLEDMKAASDGDEEAIASLSAEDLAKVNAKKGREYYAGLYSDISKRLSAEEERGKHC